MQSPPAMAQSAMEYLMTYGWAILIIAVILGVLFSLGVFNPTNYAPKVPAGNCHVFRPNGPGTNFNVNLVGTCSGFLPQYVAQFNGRNSYVSLPSAAEITGNQITVVLWAISLKNINQFNMTWSQDTTYLATCQPYSHALFSVYTTVQEDSYSPNCTASGVWIQYAGTYDGSTIKFYINGVLAGTPASQSGNINAAPSQIGSYGAPGPYNFNGSIANVQIYNASLDANEISYLYNEGIGGAPVYLSHLVGWWPLNGDAKDYSGNGYHGTPYNLSFNGSWTSGYTSP